jgi:protein SCO1/2
VWFVPSPSRQTSRPTSRPTSRCRTLRRLAIGVAVGALVVAMAGCSSSSGAGIEPPGPSIGSRLDRPVPAAIAHLTLTTDTGTHTSLAAFHGKTVLLTDFLTLCADACPLVSQEFADIDRQVTSAGLQHQVQLVELTVDPKRDTPARLAAYRKIFDAPPNWSLLTASPTTIAAIWKYFGAYYQSGAPDEPGEIDWWTHQPVTYDVDHSDDLIFLDSDGNQRFVIEGLPDVKGQQLPAAMSAYLDALGERHANRPNREAWTTPQAMTVLGWLLGRRIAG